MADRSGVPNTKNARFVSAKLGRFALRIVRSFLSNRGLDLAGAVAYNGLLSVIPLFMLASVTFARFVDRERFVTVVMREVRQLMPGANARPITEALRTQLELPYEGGAIGVVSLLFFSTLAFRTLQHALDVIFAHRRDAHPPRHLLMSILISLVFVLSIGLASVLQALSFVSLRAIPWLAAHAPSQLLLGLFGFLGMTIVLSSVYLVLPFGKGRFGHALAGGACAAALWHGVQLLLVWYLEHVSSVNVIYGSMAAVVVVLFSFELVAIIVLLGAQLIAELEKSRMPVGHERRAE
jgi:membrane protein